MDLITYQKAAQRTVKDLGQESVNIAHMALGMASELSELEECLSGDIIDKVNLGEELGDKMWYAVNYATFREINLSLFTANTPIMRRLTIKGLYSTVIIEGGRFADIAKRYLAYGQKIEDQKIFTKEVDILFAYMGAIENIAAYYMLDIKEIMGRNITKLYARYPEKFSEDKALVRDLEAERAALEGK